MFAFWAMGFVFGFVGSMPIAGPVSVLVLGRALAARFRGAFLIAVGAALAESTYAFMAAWGMSYFVTRHRGVLHAMRGVGAVALISMGLVFALRQPKQKS